MDTYDDWTLGGIYRDVTLEAMPRKQWIDNVTAVTRFDGDYRNADLEVSTIVANTGKNTLPGNYPSPGKDYVLRLSLTDKEGKDVASCNITVKGHVSTSRETRHTLHLTAPQKWTAETPYLYTLRVELLGEDGMPTQTYQEKIGIREVSTRGGVLRINGQAVKLGGASQMMYDPSFIGPVMLRCQDNDVKVNWQVFVDDRVVGSGTGSVDAAPHTVADLPVNVREVGTLKSEETAYVQLVFLRSNGEEIASKSSVRTR